MESAFQNALDAQIDDYQLRCVFADWLDELGDPRGPVYRLLGVLELYPLKWSAGYVWFNPAFKKRRLPVAFLPACLPWWNKLQTERVWWVTYSTRREAEEAAVAAFLNMRKT